MRLAIVVHIFLLFLGKTINSNADNLPTVYEYYTKDGIRSGLSDRQPYFTLNGKYIKIFSGSIHYFRVPPEYWRDRLKKLRASGCNTVDTYIPWNLHQPEVSLFDFGEGGSDFQEFLNVSRFIEIAKEEDLLVIVRPGPYICAEWEFGGMPSWLLRYPGIKVRTSDTQFMDFVRLYYQHLFSVLRPLQFTNNGSIIAFQIENEYGNTKILFRPSDTKYLIGLKNIMLQNGVKELLFTSDTPLFGFSGAVPKVLATANFNYLTPAQLLALKLYQPNKPLMVMEYWTGWFDQWTKPHLTISPTYFSNTLEQILILKSSVNLYMFHGGTSWGFFNGALVGAFSTDNDGYMPDTSSYDYGAPLSENGDYTAKYFRTKTLLEKYNPVKLQQTSLPKLVSRVAYSSLKIMSQLNFEDILQQIDVRIQSKTPISMEMLDINNHSGQSNGYIVYRKQSVNIPVNSIIKIEGRVCDTVMVLINGVLVSKILTKQSDLQEFGYWTIEDSTLSLSNRAYTNATIDFVVENWGRNNFGKLDQYDQRKGLWQGNVLLNDEVLEDFEIIPIEFKKKWTTNLSNWHTPNFSQGPSLYKAILTVQNPRDTYIDMRGWRKGIVIVNGFVLSRYIRLGPQQCAYLPATFLNDGNNEIIIFEHFVPNATVEFATEPVYETLEIITW